MAEPQGEVSDANALDPDALMADSLEIDHEELGFLRDLLCASSSFYAFLGDIGIIAAPSAERLRSRLSLLSLGLAAPRAA